VVYDPADLPVALSLLEANGDGQYDDGTLPGLPYKISRPKPLRQPRSSNYVHCVRWCWSSCGLTEDARTLLARPYAADMVDEALEETVSAAIHALQGPKYVIGDALDQVPHVAGLYAIWADAGTWQMLGLKAPLPPKPLYVGKAERSLVSR
jgi:hypothetical protein